MTFPRPAVHDGNSDALLAQMAALHPVDIDLSLDRTYRLLKDLGNPHLRLPPVVHIAGTNGKGSTLSMIRAGLEAMGKRVHCYTSPHLVRFHERIVLAGEEITEPALVDVLARTLAANDGQGVTHFEATTCAAFLAFSETPADALLLEVGMGGRMDTTNVVPNPELCVITPIGMDHQSFLGPTIGAIAGEKAGIIKRQVPVVVSRQDDDALDVIEAQAERLGAPLLAQGQHWHVGVEHGRLVFQDEAGLLDLPLPTLVGGHQIENAGTALAALRALGAGDDAVEAAVTQATWPARMQRLTKGPLAETAQACALELWLDGAHNAHAIAALAKTLAAMPERETHVVFGMLDNRDAVEVLAPLAGQVASVTGVPIPGEPKSAASLRVAEAACVLGLPSGMAETVDAALVDLGRRAPGARVVLCGSLYLAGAVLRDNG